MAALGTGRREAEGGQAITTAERLAKVERELADLRAELAAGLATRQVRIVDDTGLERAALKVAEAEIIDRLDLQLRRSGNQQLSTTPESPGIVFEAGGIHARQQYEESADYGIGEYGRTRADQG